MKLSEVIARVDDIKPNAFDNATKTMWINEVEGYVQTEVFLLDVEDIVEYSWSADQSTELLVVPPHCKLYWTYLSAMIDFANGEYNKYQNTMQMYNAFMGEYMRWYALNYHPADGEAIEHGYYISAYGIAVKHGFVGTEEEWLAALRGERGDSPELQYDDDKLQWKYSEEETWRDLLDITELRTDVENDTIAQVEAAKTAAQGYASNASASATEAASSASAAAGSAAEASASAAEAASSASEASGYASATAGYVTDAQGYAAAAASSASAAQTAASEAAAETAEEVRTEMQGYVTSATSKASEAATSAANAASSVSAAAAKASEASNSASAAATSASNAASSASAASTSAANASSSASAAASAASTAASETATEIRAEMQGYATSAAGSASAAASSATAAQTAAETAAEEAAEETASEIRSEMQGYADSASESAEDSEAWSVGQRGGVDVPSTDETYHNNSKYWAEQAAQAAGGGVSSFNGRSGVVEPMSGDYTAEMVGASEKAESFSVTLLASAWNNGAQTVSNSKFLSGDYAYIVCPDDGSYTDYTSAMIYASDVETAGQMTFHAAETPAVNLTVNILRTEVKANG